MWVGGARRGGEDEGEGSAAEGDDVFFLGGASLICPPINGRGPI